MTGQTVQLPDQIQDKTGTIVLAVIILFLVWLSNTGRLIGIISAFQLAGVNIKNNANKLSTNPSSAIPGIGAAGNEGEAAAGSVLSLPALPPVQSLPPLQPFPTQGNGITLKPL